MKNPSSDKAVCVDSTRPWEKWELFYPDMDEKMRRLVFSPEIGRGVVIFENQRWIFVHGKREKRMETPVSSLDQVFCLCIPDR